MRNYLIFFTAGLSIFMNAIDATVIAVAFPNFTETPYQCPLVGVDDLDILHRRHDDNAPGGKSERQLRPQEALHRFPLALHRQLPSLRHCARYLFSYSLQAPSGHRRGLLSSYRLGHRERSLPGGPRSGNRPFCKHLRHRGRRGPNLGGWIVSQYSWRYIFYINVPIGVLLIISTMVLLKESVTVTRPRIDLAGVALMSGSLLALMLGLNFIAESFTLLIVLFSVLLFFASVLLAVLFLRQEKRRKSRSSTQPCWSRRPSLRRTCRTSSSE